MSPIWTEMESVSLGTPQQPWGHELFHLALCLGGPLQPSSSPLASISQYFPIAPTCLLLVSCHSCTYLIEETSATNFSSEWQAKPTYCQGLEVWKPPWMLGEAVGSHCSAQQKCSEKNPRAQSHTASASLACTPGQHI